MLKKKLGAETIERNWYRDVKLVWYFKIPTSLIIPEGCEKIGRYAFCDCWWLKKVEIPKNIEDIGIGAFKDCNNATIILRKSRKDVKYIGIFAFWQCRNVKEEVGN